MMALVCNIDIYVCMYVCVYVYIYIYACTYVCIYVCKYVHAELRFRAYDPDGAGMNIVYV